MRIHPLGEVRSRGQTRKRRALVLPNDPSIDRLPAETRAAIADHWSHRASAELGVAVAFEALRPRLHDVKAADVVLTLADKAIDDERRHGELCARLAARYRGEAVALPAPRDGALPDFGTGDEPLEVALIVMGMCCINESIASEWIRSCWRAATAATAISANKYHLHDEIDHARLGWAHLSSNAISAALHASLRAWVPKLLAVNVAQWKKADPFLPAEGVPAHGHLSFTDNEAVIDAAVRDVVLPGFTHIGLA